VGRFEDGTPLALHPGPGAVTPANDFDYEDDPAGSKCPLSAHIRTMNGRSGSANISPILARRGQSYDYRGEEDQHREDKQVNRCGLLFMGLAANVQHQFERLQQKANGEPRAIGGPVVVDRLIGQPSTDDTGTVALSTSWGGRLPSSPEPCTFASCVTMLGGEYFFLPSLPFLRNIASTASRPPLPAAAPAAAPPAPPDGAAQ
jgi:hypothetical protein